MCGEGCHGGAVPEDEAKGAAADIRVTLMAAAKLPSPFQPAQVRAFP